MTDNFAYYVGPVDDENPPFTLIIVFSGTEEPREFSGKSLDDAMQKVLKDFPAKTLCVDQALKDKFPDLDLQISPYSAHHALDLGKVIYNLVEPGYMDDLQRSGLIYQLLVGASEFIKQAAWERIVDFEVRVSGDETYSSFGTIVAPSGKIESVMTFDTKADRENAKKVLTQAVGVTNQVKVDATVVRFSKEPLYASDALSRGYDLPFFPAVYHLFDKKESRVTDEALSAMTGVLFAAARIGKGEDSSFADINFSDLNIRANISRE